MPTPTPKAKLNRTTLLTWDIIPCQLNKVSKEIKVSTDINPKSLEARAVALEVVTEGIEEVSEMIEVIEVIEMREEIVMTATEIEIEMIEIAEIVEIEVIEVIEVKEEEVETTEVTEVIEGRESLIQETKEVIITKEIEIPVADLVVIVESLRERMLTVESPGIIKTEKVMTDMVIETTLINPTTDIPLEVAVIICLF